LGAPCDTCRPNILLENREALSIYPYCSRQLLLGATGQAISLRVESVEIIINRFDCYKKAETLSKILSLSEEIISFQNVNKSKSQMLERKGKK